MNSCAGEDLANLQEPQSLYCANNPAFGSSLADQLTVDAPISNDDVSGRSVQVVTDDFRQKLESFEARLCERNVGERQDVQDLYRLHDVKCEEVLKEKHRADFEKLENVRLQHRLCGSERELYTASQIIENLEKQLQQAEMKYRTLCEDKKQLQETNMELRMLLAGKDRKLESARQVNSDQDGKLKVLLATISLLEENEHAVKSTVIKSMKDDLEVMLATISEIEKALSALTDMESEVKGVLTSITNKEHEQVKMQGKWKIISEQMPRRNQELEQKRADNKTSCEQHVAQLFELKERVESLELRGGMHDEQLRKGKAHVEALSSEITVLKRKLHVSESFNAVLLEERHIKNSLHKLMQSGTETPYEMSGYLSDAHWLENVPPPIYGIDGPIRPMPIVELENEGNISSVLALSSCSSTDDEMEENVISSSDLSRQLPSGKPTHQEQYEDEGIDSLIS